LHLAILCLWIGLSTFQEFVGGKGIFCVFVFPENEPVDIALSAHLVCTLFLHFASQVRTLLILELAPFPSSQVGCKTQHLRPTCALCFLCWNYTQHFCGAFYCQFAETLADPYKGKSLYLGLTHSKSHLLPARTSRKILQILGGPTNIWNG
jgi:hypothetical protein